MKNYVIITINDYKGGELGGVEGKYSLDELYIALAELAFEEINDLEQFIVDEDESGEYIDPYVDKKYLKEYLDNEIFVPYAGYNYSCYYVLDLGDLGTSCADTYIDGMIDELANKILIYHKNDID